MGDTDNEIRRMRRSRVLLGASGSVAVVKVPEIAVKLHRDLEADVRIVLTHGAQYFWGEKTKEYDKYHWIELQKRMAPLSEESETDRRILVYGTCICRISIIFKLILFSQYL